MGNHARRRLTVPFSRWFFAMFASAVISSSAFAQDEETWRCDADYGSYSENPQPISPAARTLSGRIQFHSGHMGDYWNPGAVIAFTDSKRPRHDDCFCEGIRADIYRAEPNIVKFLMIFDGQSVAIAQALVGKAITLNLSIDSNGILTVVIGKTNPGKWTARLQHPQHDTAMMFCTGSDVSFLNLQAG
jgi:hypothetical protein